MLQWEISCWSLHFWLMSFAWLSKRLNQRGRLKPSFQCNTHSLHFCFCFLSRSYHWFAVLICLRFFLIFPFYLSCFFVGYFHQRFQLPGLLQCHSCQFSAATAQRTWWKEEMRDFLQSQRSRRSCWFRSVVFVLFVCAECYIKMCSKYSKSVTFRIVSDSMCFFYL